MQMHPFIHSFNAAHECIVGWEDHTVMKKAVTAANNRPAMDAALVVAELHMFPVQQSFLSAVKVLPANGLSFSSV